MPGNELGNYGESREHNEWGTEEGGTGRPGPKPGDYTTPDPKYGFATPAKRNIYDRDTETLQEMYDMAEDALNKMDKVMGVLVDLNRYHALTLATQLRDDLRIVKREVIQALGRQGLTLTGGG